MLLLPPLVHWGALDGNNTGSVLSDSFATHLQPIAFWGFSQRRFRAQGHNWSERRLDVSELDVLSICGRSEGETRVSSCHGASRGHRRLL